ncbi:Peptide ABC transporter substrate-binding protein [Rhodovastum atsumiense]|uniref:Peptide ABC transporter substrate-binding protein n=1 Tax=Rhodovastum atsumiense TaxID=504468 RepID=A0A5M6IST4_9PROT|nr:ABC transporter substrate-binding protein [Rhodovastum atsumiense]KAA5611376.1 peptide ABC transporter substrate-binding protein [Rhodovastum atsumiense]CAH2603619.1 Peptide ABC transporter substrate-binding protein [Rhodovastum atsumiense]
MAMSLPRRAVLAGAAATLPFLRVPGARARTPGVLTFGLSSYPPTIQPWANSGTAAGTIKLMIYRGLLSYGPDGNLRAELAESWTHEGDSTWVFKLRPATFHNGEKVTSADVKWTLEQVGGAQSTAYFRAEMQTIERIETPDERTVRIVTRTPVATLPTWMASYHMPIISRASPRGQFIGAGPFTLTAQERGVSLDLTAFPGFYRPGLPKLKGVRVVTYADENLRVAALQSGDVDLIEYVPWQAMDAISANPALRLDTIDGPFMFLTFNGTRPPFNDARVRRAVAHAIRRDELVKAAFFGRGAPLAHLPIPANSPFYNPEFKDAWAYDPDLSRRLLKEAGYGGGISCGLLATAQYSMHKDTAEVVQQHLAAVGINAQLNLPDWATRVAIGNRGQYDIAVQGTAADSNDADGIASFIDGSLSPAYVRSFGLKTPRVTELLAAGRAEFDEAKRRDIYREMERVAIEDVPIASLTWRSQGYAMRREVTGFTNLPGALTFYSGLTFETTAVG